MRSGRLLISAFVIPLILLSVSCSPERRLANSYVKKQEPVSVLLLMPDFSFKYAYKVPDVENFDSLGSAVQDSLLFFNSDLVQYLDDSIVISSYLEGLSSGLKNYGFNVFTSGMADGFVNSGTEALIFNLAQLQFEEFFDSISDEVSFGEEELYNYELFITALNINSWFELSGVNHYDTSTRILYTSQTITDYFDGGFRYFPFSGEVKYSYTLDSLKTSDVYRVVKDIGLQYSDYLYDYLMNDYVQKNLPPGTRAEQTYTYDRQAGVVRKNKGQGFIRLN
ncbi:MAG: hypothetical protein FD166_3050 [Bacteroidetes bacterium]|nr:MAG: hypothetical protein FD166_3050 [Bacteroidota bacterium]